jgi:hypothetical protein
MKVSRQEYDKLPFAVRTGALIMWGTQLVSYSKAGLFRQLYSFNGFFAEMCFDEYQEQLDNIHTFADIKQLDPYIRDIDLQTLLV